MYKWFHPDSPLLQIYCDELCPFHEITGFTLTLFEKVPRTQNYEKSSKKRDFFLKQT